MSWEGREGTRRGRNVEQDRQSVGRRGGGKGSSYVLCCEIGPQQHTDLGKLLLHTSFGRDLVL